MHVDRKYNGGCQGPWAVGNGKLFNGCKILVLQDEKSSRDWLYSNVSVLNTTTF